MAENFVYLGYCKELLDNYDSPIHIVSAQNLTCDPITDLNKENLSVLASNVINLINSVNVLQSAIGYLVEMSC